MKRITILLLSLLVVCSSAFAGTRRCTACGGSGKKQTRYGMSSFGLNNQKMLCQYCNQWILASEPHWDPCDRCGTLGYIEDGWSNKNTNGYDIYVYLDPNDAAMLKNLLYMRMKGTKQVQTACNHCRGTGRCPVCGGGGWMMGTQPCAGCSMQGTCSACYGSRVVYTDVYLSRDEIQLLEQRIKYFLNIAYSRMQ